jgi:hypothetical protein
MDPFMTELFGRGSREGLLHWIRDGTLAIYNVHKAVSGCASLHAGLHMYTCQPGCFSRSSCV